MAPRVSRAGRLAIVSVMTTTTRPTAKWRELFREQEAAVAAGTMQEDDAYAAHLWPIDFTEAVDSTLSAYESEVSAMVNPSDDAVFEAIKGVVLSLNEVNEEYGRIETGEREELCEFISLVLEEAGIDTKALAARRGIGEHELTDGWRDW
jgi:hypothetical protein